VAIGADVRRLEDGIELRAAVLAKYASTPGVTPDCRR
jgi:hypothetical protein